MNLTRGMIERKQVRVSVIVPAFNAARDIAECVDALRASDYANLEIIVVDDCSTDGTSARCRDSPCRVLRTERRTGPAGARNLGIQNARGEMIAFVDADIVVKPPTIRLLLESFLERLDIASVCGIYDRECKYRNLSSLYQRSYNEYKRGFLPAYGPYLSTAICCIPREALRALGGLRPHLYTSEDYELGVRLAAGSKVNYFNRSITVTHNKYASLRDLVRQKFQYATNMTMLTLEMKAGETPAAAITTTFSVAVDQMLAVALSLPAIAACALAFATRAPAAGWAALAIVLGYCAANLRYWMFLFRNAGPVAALFLPLSLLEQVISQLAMLNGVIRFRRKMPYWGYRGIL